MLPDEDVTTPQDAPPEEAPVLSTDDMLRQLLAEQQHQRAEVAEMRAELNKARAPVPPAASATVMTPEEAAIHRQQQIADFAYYCPGCGALYKRERECSGRGEAPHPAIEVVSTDEIKGDNAVNPDKHTAAPGVKP